MTTTPRWPKRPAKLEPGSYWVAVETVHKSAGHGPGERTWCCELIGGCSTEQAAKVGAEVWWKQTDQSGECEVTFSVERANGTIVSHRVWVGMVLTARAVRA